MSPFAPLIREFRIWFYRWAAAEIHPMHPDAPWVHLRLADLLRQRRTR